MKSLSAFWTVEDECYDYRQGQTNCAVTAKHSTCVFLPKYFEEASFVYSIKYSFKIN
jgi:hypothetical protein